jgi:acyl carrier protein phosphodiesterase
MDCHRCIDVFTDRHPLVRRSVQQIRPPHRRFAPILIDIFYDHFLSVEWAHHCPQPLDQFVQEVYASFGGHRAQLPATTYGHLQRMRAENWLSAYQEIAGVRVTLERIARRLRRPVQLGEAVVELVRNYDALHADFDEFFPELRSHVEARFANPDSPSLVPACQ